MGTDKSRYNLPPYTEGWFQVAWSRDVKPGSVHEVRYFGREYCLFRGDDGALGLIDDICPHLGARFSVGGCVRGNAVRCPYHGWEFDRTGACTGIDYAKKIPKKARVDSFTVVERYGMIFMYRNEAGGRAPYDLPTIADFDPSDYLPMRAYTFRARIHAQDLLENSVDRAHFAEVHGHSLPQTEWSMDGNTMLVSHTSSVRRLGIHMHARQEFNLIEPGFQYNRFPVLPFGAQGMVVSSIVPEDEEYTVNHIGVYVKPGRIPGIAHAIQRFITWQMMDTYQEDRQIWEHKAYREHPVLCDGDGPIMRYRQWYASFYPKTKRSLEIIRA